jgi:hypothetical protein
MIGRLAAQQRGILKSGVFEEGGGRDEEGRLGSRF